MRRRPVDALKVPSIDPQFWVLKLLTTALGEAVSDALIKRFAPVATVMVTGLVFSAVLVYQLTRPRYSTFAYWAAVVMVGVFGTMAADSVHIALGVSYPVSAGSFGAGLAVVFLVWRRCEGTLDIHSVTAGRSELFYWAAVVATFALGTALGDLTAYTWGWGYLTSGFVFLGLFALPGLAFYVRRLGPIAAFWGSYVLTRPLGASFADLMGKPVVAGGEGWHSSHVAVVLAALFVAGVAWQRRRDHQVAGATVSTLRS